MSHARSRGPEGLRWNKPKKGCNKMGVRRKDRGISDSFMRILGVRIRSKLNIFRLDHLLLNAARV